MELTPPSLTLNARLLIRGMGATDRWSRRRAALTAILGFAAVALLECLIDPTISLGFFYLLACALAVWCLGERYGLMVSATGALTSSIIKHVQLNEILTHPITFAAEAWGLAARLLSFVLLATIVSGLRGVLAQERWQGEHDSLTGALNKGALERAMPTYIADAKAARRSMLFAYMDLDGFKGLNDHHGHSAGDRVLGLFAAAAARAIRARDLFARIGGDEFALLLTLPDGVEGTRIAETLHDRLSAILRSTGMPVTCSMGALLVECDELTGAGDFLDQADALMYEAKHAGRNALRVGRPGVLSASLRHTYRPVPARDASINALLARIDLADQGLRGADRRAA